MMTYVWEEEPRCCTTARQEPPPPQAARRQALDGQQAYAQDGHGWYR